MSESTDSATDPQIPLAPHILLQSGVIPIRKGSARFAVGSPLGITSNSWKLVASKNGDIYIACRDNMREVKVSLHWSGRWRIGFTAQATERKPELLKDGRDRAWEVWDAPEPISPGVIVGFRILFPSSELAVLPAQRHPNEWRKVIYVEAAPPGKMVVATVFVTDGPAVLEHESEPSVCLASLPARDGRFAQLVLHGESLGRLPSDIETAVAAARQQSIGAGIAIPDTAYGYFWGRHPDGSRFLYGARMKRDC